MRHTIKRNWFARFPEDLAWDIFTLDCILATILAMGIAGIAATSDAVAQYIVDSQGWVWGMAVALAVIAAVCFARVVLNDRLALVVPQRGR